MGYLDPAPNTHALCRLPNAHSRTVHVVYPVAHVDSAPDTHAHPYTPSCDADRHAHAAAGEHATRGPTHRYTKAAARVVPKPYHVTLTMVTKRKRLHCDNHFRWYRKLRKMLQNCLQKFEGVLGETGI